MFHLLVAALQNKTGRGEGTASFSDLQPWGGGNERKAWTNCHLNATSDTSGAFRKGTEFCSSNVSCVYFIGLRRQAQEKSSIYRWTVSLFKTEHIGHTCCVFHGRVAHSKPIPVQRNASAKQFTEGEKTVWLVCFLLSHPHSTGLLRGWGVTLIATKKMAILQWKVYRTGKKQTCLSFVSFSALALPLVKWGHILWLKCESSSQQVWSQFNPPPVIFSAFGSLHRPPLCQCGLFFFPCFVLPCTVG